MTERGTKLAWRWTAPWAVSLAVGIAARAQEAPATAAPASPPATTSAVGSAQVAFATGTIAEMSSGPDLKASYPHYIMKFYLKDLVDDAGRPSGSGDGVVCVLAMHHRKVLPPAGLKKGDRLAVRLTPWEVAETRYGKIQSGSLPTVQLEIEKPMFWGEAAGQPALTAADLAKVGQDDSPEARSEAVNSPDSAVPAAKPAAHTPATPAASGPDPSNAD